MDSKAIRDRFLSFFAARDHERVASSSVVPNDPTVLFTNSGMIQFKPYFLGEQTPPFPRAVTAQKCVRAGGKHNDLEEVGKTARHLTFFEMLGNFSFGDYYKEKACPWAWELVTEGWGMDPELLWVSVYETDEEARAIWIDGVGVRPERVVRLGKADNFWSTGAAGPCGPCSEILIDRGDAFGPAGEGPASNEERYLEFWNLVFMQNDCNDALDPVAELPTKNIDTGAGLERIAMILQGASNVFETDVLAGMVERASELTKVAIGADERSDIGLKILADHGRAVAFMIADGVLPSNEERGYVLRRIMRRALRHARLLGREDPILGELAATCVSLMGDEYPELEQRKDFILEVASREEERFGATLKQGLSLLEGEIERARSTGGGSLPGDVAFRLHDTFGFPIDLTTEITSEAGLTVDQAGFDLRMGEQRARARAARAGDHDADSTAALRRIGRDLGATEFYGFEHLDGAARVVAIIEGAEARPRAGAGDEVDLVLDRTVFYAEGGGQVGDRGRIEAPGGHALVMDTRRVAPGITGHRVRVTDGEIIVGDEVGLAVEGERRAGAARAHTATHVLHWTLRDRLGEHATQAGSLVEPGRLRFDFNHFDALTSAQTEEISGELEQRVLDDDSVRAYETSFDFARSIGAMAIFGEKYGDFVRVVEVGDYSKELCGGTHVTHTSMIGPVVVTAEGSIGANLRRVEALVGREGLDFLRRRAVILDRAAAELRVAPEEVAARVERLQATNRTLERRIAEVERQSQDADAAALADGAVDCNGSRLVVARRDIGVDGLRALAQSVRGRLGSAVIVLGAATGGKANLVGAVSKDLTARGVSARELLAPGAALLGGGAGGKPELAISGGPDADRLQEAIDTVARAARAALVG
jgi:alanyl-tRNA synthetase